MTEILDDDFVDYQDDYEDDELSAEDHEAMKTGTAEVQQTLGPDASKVTVAQIQDSLWHYYYDVDKSVAYLRRNFISPAPKPASKSVSKPTVKPNNKPPEGKLDDPSFLEALSLFVRAAGAHRGSPSTPVQTRRCLHTEFDDMPWLHVPEHRIAHLIPPLQPKGGLLGGGDGSPRMSKLQALAAARKKKQDAKKEQEKTMQAEAGMKRLSLSHHVQESEASSPKRHKGSETLSPRPSISSPSTTPASMEYALLHEPSPPVDSVTRPAPSALAQTLFDPTPARLLHRPELFAMPYASSSVFSCAAFSQPSPDDVVLAAQAQAGNKAPPKTKKSEDKKTSNAGDKQTQAVEGLSALKISDTAPKTKGLDVMEEFLKSNKKRSTSFVVVGHVDAGKSTLMGRLLLELKHVEQRTIDKYRRQAEKTGKQSFALAWVMDQGSEERDRGVTMDIATNHFETPTTRFTILDAPGHRDFVPNMIAGASQADLAILVVDANTGAFEKGLKGQTREHVLLLRSLGVQRLIVAVNKLDMVAWSKERFEEIAEQVGGFLTGLGFQSKHVSFIPISGLNGDNVALQVKEAAASWYTGSTLMEALEAPGPSTVTKTLEKPFRMPISEVFRSPQQGTTTLAGRIDAGTVQIGDEVLVQPSGEAAHVKSIMVDMESQDWAVAGQSVSISLANIDAVHIRVGDIVCDAKQPVLCGDSFTMKAMAFDHVMPMPVDLHRGRLHVAGQIESMVALLDKATGTIIKKKPRVVQPGGVARMVVRLSTKVPLEAGQRVVIRSGGETIAAGLLE
ncbi:hypothetical protein CDD81_886 [Ophiocordyceps australis]|uniref:Elongation factor 1 alpha-like protein n=1 Tax=Ophiocordyceps australis TaxID=1399860 RepID=A0A2C5XKT9_9HYPO|nr:hypothetical protein CDD81_886 [Ophiocordyceps australis]